MMLFVLSGDAMPKQRIRQEQLSARVCLSLEQREVLSSRAQQRLLNHDIFADAQTVALYAPIRCEVDTSMLLQAAMKSAKRVVYPRVWRTNAGQTGMDFFEVTSADDLHPGAFGVLEPHTDCAVSVGEIDLVVVPGVAFDRSGYRLGYGKGYYDRAMRARSAKCVLAGLGYAFQLEADLPREAHDLVLDWLITDHETLSFGDISS